PASVCEAAMTSPRGRYLPLSWARRVGADFLHFAHKIPTVPVQRVMNLARLRAARAGTLPRISWTILFTKAYALLAREVPVLRRWLWWAGLNVSGPRRAKYFGTFAVSVYSALGAESLHPITPLTTTLNYGLIAADGSVPVRIVYDHRLIDGATIARGLGRLEE